MDPRNRTDLGILSIANAVIHLGRMYILPTILIELSTDFSLSLFQLGSIITLIIIIETISLPLCGYISDRVNRSFTLPVSLLIFGVFFGVIGFTGKRSLGIFVVGLIVIGLMASFYHTAAISLLLDLFDAKNRGKAQSIHGTGARIGGALGPTLVGVIFIVDRPWSDVYLILAFPVFIVAFLLFLKRVGANIERSRAELNQVEEKNRLALKFKTTGILKALVLLTIVRSISAIQLEMLSFIFPTFLTEQGHSPATAAFLFSWMTVTGIIGVLLSGYLTDRVGPRLFLMVAYTFQGVATALLVITGGTNWIIISSVIYGIATSTTFPAFLSLLGQYSTMYRRGMTYAMTGILPGLFRAVAPTVDGYIVETRSTPQIFLIGIVLAFINVGLVPLLKQREKTNT